MQSQSEKDIIDKTEGTGGGFQPKDMTENVQGQKGAQPEPLVRKTRKYFLYIKLIPVEHAKKVKLGKEDAQEIAKEELKTYLKPKE